MCTSFELRNGNAGSLQEELTSQTYNVCLPWVCHLYAQIVNEQPGFFTLVEVVCRLDCLSFLLPVRD